MDRRREEVALQKHKQKLKIRKVQEREREREYAMDPYDYTNTYDTNARFPMC